MKYTTLLIAALSFNSLAADCEKYSELAEGIMMHRQSGTSIIKVLKVLNKTSEPIVIAAYKEPLWSTEENKKLAITEFANDVYLTCIDRTGESDAL